MTTNSMQFDRLNKAIQAFHSNHVHIAKKDCGLEGEGRVGFAALASLVEKLLKDNEISAERKAILGISFQEVIHARKISVESKPWYARVWTIFLSTIFGVNRNLENIKKECDHLYGRMTPKLQSELLNHQTNIGSGSDGDVFIEKALSFAKNNPIFPPESKINHLLISLKDYPLENKSQFAKFLSASFRKEVDEDFVKYIILIFECWNALPGLEQKEFVDAISYNLVIGNRSVCSYAGESCSNMSIDEKKQFILDINRLEPQLNKIHWEARDLQQTFKDNFKYIINLVDLCTKHDPNAIDDIRHINLPPIESYIISALKRLKDISLEDKEACQQFLQELIQDSQKMNPPLPGWAFEVLSNSSCFELQGLMDCAAKVVCLFPKHQEPLLPALSLLEPIPRKHSSSQASYENDLSVALDQQHRASAILKFLIAISPIDRVLFTKNATLIIKDSYRERRFQALEKALRLPPAEVIAYSNYLVKFTAVKAYYKPSDELDQLLEENFDQFLLSLPSEKRETAVACRFQIIELFNTTMYQKMQLPILKQVMDFPEAFQSDLIRHCSSLFKEHPTHSEQRLKFYNDFLKKIPDEEKGDFAKCILLVYEDFLNISREEDVDYLEHLEKIPPQHRLTTARAINSLRLEFKKAHHYASTYAEAYAFHVFKVLVKLPYREQIGFAKIMGNLYNKIVFYVCIEDYAKKLTLLPENERESFADLSLQVEEKLGKELINHMDTANMLVSMLPIPYLNRNHVIKIVLDLLDKVDREKEPSSTLRWFWSHFIDRLRLIEKEKAKSIYLKTIDLLEKSKDLNKGELRDSFFKIPFSEENEISIALVSCMIEKSEQQRSIWRTSFLIAPNYRKNYVNGIYDTHHDLSIVFFNFPEIRSESHDYLLNLLTSKESSPELKANMSKLLNENADSMAIPRNSPLWLFTEKAPEIMRAD